MGILRTIRTIAWGQPPDSKAESRLLLKVDFFVLSYVCLMYWVNYLDRANLNNAYVSGAQQDLKFKGTLKLMWTLLPTFCILRLSRHSSL